MTLSRAASPGRWQRLAEESFNDHAVPPLPFELAVTLIDAHHPEPAPFMQGHARDILREDSRHDLPEPALGIGPAEGLQRRTPRARPASGPGHIHRMLRHAG